MSLSHFLRIESSLNDLCKDLNPLQLLCYYFPFKMDEALRLKKNFNLWKFDWNWHRGYIKEKGCVPSFQQFQKNLSLSFKEDLNPVYLKLSLRIWKKRFKCFQCIFTILLIRACPFITSVESPVPKNALCQVWLKLTSDSGEEVRGPSFEQTDDGQQMITKAHFSSQLRWAKMFHQERFWTLSYFQKLTQIIFKLNYTDKVQYSNYDLQ